MRWVAVQGRKMVASGQRVSAIRFGPSTFALAGAVFSRGFPSFFWRGPFLFCFPTALSAFVLGSGQNSKGFPCFSPFIRICLTRHANMTVGLPAADKPAFFLCTLVHHRWEPILCRPNIVEKYYITINPDSTSITRLKYTF